MFKVLIVEDEILVRIGLKNSIPWSKFEMEVIADVSNGEEALRVYESDKPDLIITDLKMPVMDGLTFISTVRQTDSDTKIVILSCIEEFEYARKAANLKVSGYILKLTMTLDEIEQILSSIQTELNTRSLHAPVLLNQRMNMNTLKEKLIRDYLFYGTYSESELSLLLKQLDSSIGEGRMALALMETSEYTRLLKRFNDERGELIRFTLLNLLNEILKNYDAGEAYHDNENRYLLFFSFDEKETEEQSLTKLNDIFSNIQKAMSRYFDIPVYIGVSSFSYELAALKKMYLACSAVIKTRFFSESTVVFAANSEKMDQDDRWKQLVRDSFNVWKSLGSDAYAALKKEAEAQMDQALHNERGWKQKFIDLIGWTSDYLGIPDEHSNIMGMASAERIHASSTIQACIQVWENHLHEIAKVKATIKSVSKEVADVVQYIHQHYDKNISLKEISDFVQLSPNYLSLLFKKNMGCNLFEFLNEYRVEKAKELLMSTTLKTYEIAENVGVPDSAYFSRIFKKSTGVAPIDFRKKKVLSRKTVSYEDA